jgi:hypothetical protein
MARGWTLGLKTEIETGMTGPPAIFSTTHSPGSRPFDAYEFMEAEGHESFDRPFDSSLKILGIRSGPFDAYNKFIEAGGHESFDRLRAIRCL